MMPRVSNEQAIALRPPIEERLEYSSPKRFKSRLGLGRDRKKAGAIRTREDVIPSARLRWPQSDRSSPGYQQCQSARPELRVCQSAPSKCRESYLESRLRSPGCVLV